MIQFLQDLHRQVHAFKSKDRAFLNNKELDKVLICINKSVLKLKKKGVKSV